MSTYYSIVRDGIHVFDNVNNQSCYATLFSVFAPVGTYEKFVQPNSFFELYIPLREFQGGFKTQDSTKKFLNSIKKMGFDFDVEFVQKLPRGLGVGWKVSFDISKESKIKIKVGTYLIRFMWEILPAGFDDYYFQILKKYGKKISHFSLFKYAYYNFALFYPNKYYLGHALPRAYAVRDYKNNLQEKLNGEFRQVYETLFSTRKLPPFSLELLKNSHFPQDTEDSINNLEKYLNNPQLELDN